MAIGVHGNGKGGNGRPTAAAASAPAPAVAMRGVRKVYDTGAIKVEALRGIDLDVKRNEFLSIVGPSGSGKSTLLNLIGCLDTATEGSYRLSGEDVSRFSGDQLADVRNRRIGFIFQNFNLLPAITAYENVELPRLFQGLAAGRRRARVERLFEQVGLADRMRHKPTELSGGQMQRVAIARALACEPDLILADEPTGNLDTSSGKDILHLFEELAGEGRTLLVITHDPGVASRTHRTVRIQDGLITEDRAVG